VEKECALPVWVRRLRFATRQVIFGEQAFFTEAQIASDGANEAAAEDAARQFRPIFIFQGLEKTRTDAGRLRDFIERDSRSSRSRLRRSPTYLSPCSENRPRTICAAPPEEAGRLSWLQRNK